MLNYANMNASLPNYQNLEQRIEKLIEEFTNIREYTRTNMSNSDGLSNDTKADIKNKIQNLLNLIDEFDNDNPSSIGGKN